MECKNHPSVEATGRCTGCAEPFCPDCLVEIQGQQYCAACKTMALRPGAAPVLEEATIPCKEASEALGYALFGIICFGIILEPVAISKALKARKMIAMNPRLSGSGKATAALIIGCVALVFWVIGMVARFAAMNKR